MHTVFHEWCTSLLAATASRAWHFCALFALLTHPAHLIAQRDSSSAHDALVRINIVGPDDHPVADAEVVVKDGRVERVARSDTGGVARFDGVHPGSIQLRVRRVGYAAKAMGARVEAGNNEFTIHIDGATVSLDRVRIIGNRTVSARLEGFEERLRLGAANATITQRQIEKRNPIAVSQMLRGIVGLRIADSLGSVIAISRRGEVLDGRKMQMVDCRLRLMVDGIIMPIGTSIDGIIPRDVYGVEVFLGASRVPVQFDGIRKEAWCGLIAIWTRDQ